MQKFKPEILKSALPAFNWSQNQNNQSDGALESALQNYLEFYKLQPLLDHSQQQIGVEQIAGFEIVVQRFSVQNPVATVLMVHGYYDHVGLYGNLINFCLKHNLNVVTFDLPGHGLSSGTQACIDDFQQYDEVFTYLLEKTHKFDTLPLYAFGQSTGGAIIINHLLKTRNAQKHLHKAVLFAPLVRPIGWKLGFPIATVAQFFIQHTRRHIVTSPVNPEFSDFLRQDPLQAKKLSIKWVNALRRWLPYWLALEPLDFPLYVIQGDQDKTVDWQKNQKIIEQKFPLRKLYTLEHAHHHLVNDTPEKQAEMFAQVSQWLDLQ